MRLLQISSERYQRVSNASLEISEEMSSSHCSPSGRCRHSGPVKRQRKTPFTSTQTGEIDIAAMASELSLRTRGTPRLLVADSSVYLYLPGIAPRARPWVREKLSPARAKVLFAGLFPFHGDERGQPSLGGTGPYAGLIDLFAGALGGVRSVGQAVVSGQPTSEFEAAVAPSATAELGSPQVSLIVERPSARETVQAFISESGLPLRVVVTIAAGEDKAAQTTDILGVNVPVHIAPPPARRTIGAARFRKLSSKTNESSSSSHSEAVGQPTQSKQ
jgi:hypothetical protein